MPVKGGAYERELARDLSEWWSPGCEDVLFWRTAGSGGRATARSRKGKATNTQHCGDISALTKDGEPLTQLISLELKRGYSKYSIADILDTNDTAQQEWEAWYQQATESAKNAKSPYWMIIHRRDKRKSFCFMPFELLEKFKDVGCFDVCPQPMIIMNLNVRCETKKPKKMWFVTGVRIVGMRLQDFLKHVHKKDVLKVLAQHQGSVN